VDATERDRARRLRHHRRSPPDSIGGPRPRRRTSSFDSSKGKRRSTVNSIAKKIATVVTLAGATLPVAAVHAAPAATLAGGYTIVTLDDQVFLPALQSLHITPAAIAPGRLRSYRGGATKASFPIITGVADTGTLNADIDHSGGLSLSCGSTEVDLTAFDIDTVQKQLTGVVVVRNAQNQQQGDVAGRLPLFKLDLSAPAVKAGKHLLSVGNVGLSLTPGAVAALNGAFSGCATLPTGSPIPVGTAKVIAVTQ
jgi:hypothetical protein